MRFQERLIPGILLKRYKRFLADVQLMDGRQVTAHCPNSGSLRSCYIPGNPVLLSKARNPRRKLPYTWEMIQVNGTWVGINTQYPNRLVIEAIRNGVIRELQGYAKIRQEIPYGEHSRLDLLLEQGSSKCFVEIKNVTLVEGETAYFPDAVTLRGQKHLRNLMEIVEHGHQAAVLFVVQREDNSAFAPAYHIDPVYGQLLREAQKRGVFVLAYQAKVSPEEIRIHKALPVHL